MLQPHLAVAESCPWFVTRIEVIEQMLETDAQESAIMDQVDCFAEQGCSVSCSTWRDTLPWKSGFAGSTT